jgi:transposase
VTRGKELPQWDQFLALLPERIDTHPLRCHRLRIPDRIVFDKLLQVLVFGCGYERIADQTCSARTLRRRRDEWIAAGAGLRGRDHPPADPPCLDQYRCDSRPGRHP